MAERKGKKLRRCTPASKNYYKVQFGRTDDNKKRNLRRQIRNHPNDAQSKSIYEARGFGRADTHGTTARGEARAVRAEGIRILKEARALKRKLELESKARAVLDMMQPLRPSNTGASK